VLHYSNTLVDVCDMLLEKYTLFKIVSCVIDNTQINKHGHVITTATCKYNQLIFLETSSRNSETVLDLTNLSTSSCSLTFAINCKILV